ncbi:hypothetical protein BV25DRAFT_1838914 [Artomyces pyxidatus]|uniref:Uncharacterized protein n=1 Tax=Artomyces pyxidatus TaxID=48021 RepID=A0ACB8SZT7_9AGAM|nr:hypothetical protein BV25DRAFT_1838914 [Artomyces pyxidatus]
MSLAFALPDAPEQYLTFASADPNGSSPDSIDLSDLQRLCESTIGKPRAIYRATLRSTNDKVICKVARGEPAMKLLAHEASIYRDLTPLQGSRMPHCLGHFIGDTSEGVAGCLLLEDCGEPITSAVDCLQDLDKPTKEAIFELMVAVHDAGLTHMNLQGRHLLVRDGTIKLISFEKATQHTCVRSAPIVVGGVHPYAEELSCAELHMFGINMCIWKLPGVSCWGRLHPLELLDDPLALAELGPEYDTHEERVRKARSAIEEHLKEYEPERWAARQAEQGW